jgi:hypothetical protein
VPGFLRCHAREAAGNVVAAGLRHPAVLVGKQADGHKVGRFAHVEPVTRAVRHADQVALLAQHVVDLVADVQGELAGAGDKEPYLVLAVAVFVKKFLAQRGAVRVIGGETDDIDRLIAFAAHQPVNVCAVGGDHFVLRRARLDRLFRRPLLEAHAYLVQGVADGSVFGHDLQRYVRACLVKNS